MTKKRILDVATEEFATLGYSGLSMNKLAEKLKTNKAMIYYYFKDKRNLYDEVISSIIELNEEEMKQISSLDMGYSGSRAKHFEPDFVRMVLNNKIHD
mgnify:CR=1 FL=1